MSLHLLGYAKSVPWRIVRPVICCYIAFYGITLVTKLQPLRFTFFKKEVLLYLTPEGHLGRFFRIGRSRILGGKFSKPFALNALWMPPVPGFRCPGCGKGHGAALGVTACCRGCCGASPSPWAFPAAVRIAKGLLLACKRIPFGVPEAMS